APAARRQSAVAPRPRPRRTKSLRYRHLPGTLTVRISPTGGSRRRCDPTPQQRQQVLPPRRVAVSRRCELEKPEAGCELFDATPMPQFRDAERSNGHGFLAHGAAPPPLFAAAARPGVLPEWQSACLSMPPTPRKPEWWSSAATDLRN